MTSFRRVSQSAAVCLAGLVAFSTPAWAHGDEPHSTTTTSVKPAAAAPAAKPAAKPATSKAVAVTPAAKKVTTAKKSVTTTTMAAHQTDMHTHAADSTGYDAAHDAMTPALPGTSLKIVATPDPVRGVNLHLMTTNFRFAPMSVDRHSTLGEGHVHLYVDGTKVGRAYGEWVHLMVEPGEHTIRAVLSANDHSTWSADGHAIEASAVVKVGAPAMMHHHGEVVAPDGMTFDMSAMPVMGGANVYVRASGFRFAPEMVNQAPVYGAGHAHISVDGKPMGRLYGPAAYVPLAPGPHLIEITPATNTHDALVDADGTAISVSEVVWVR